MGEGNRQYTRRTFPQEGNWLDWFGLRLTTTSVGQNCASGNRATTAQRQGKKKGGRCLRRLQERNKGRNVEVSVGTYYIGAMTGKERKL